MEDTLRDHMVIEKESKRTVLILVLMEDTLRGGREIGEKFTILGS